MVMLDKLLIKVWHPINKAKIPKVQYKILKQPVLYDPHYISNYEMCSVHGLSVFAPSPRAEDKKVTQYAQRYIQYRINVTLKPIRNTA